MSAYPSLLVLGPDGENVHRFQSFKKPPEFLVELKDALARWKLFRAGEDWDDPRPRPTVLTDAGRVSTLPAPSAGVPAGLARIGDDLWVGQGGTLYALDPESGAVRRTIEVGRTFQDFTTDSTDGDAERPLLYLVTSGWTQGEPILVLDPKDGSTVRRIVTEADAGGRLQNARGICWRDGKLWVSEIHGKIHEVDPHSGEVRSVHASGLSWVFGLAFDGRRFLMGGRDALHLLDPDTMRAVRSVPTHYRLRAVGFDPRTDAYLCMEQPVFGFGRAHEPIRVYPRTTVVHRVRLAPEREDGK